MLGAVSLWNCQDNFLALGAIAQENAFSPVHLLLLQDASHQYLHVLNGQTVSDKGLEKGRAMDDQVLQKVKECTVDYLHMRMDDGISVAEIYHDDTTQGFDVSIQGKEVPTPQRCIVMVKDGQANVVDDQDARQAFQS